MKFASITLVALIFGVAHASEAKGKGKGKGKGKKKGKSSKGEKDQCRYVTFSSKQSWTEGLVEADGTPLDTSDYKDAGQGASWTFKGQVTDLEDNAIGINYELSTLVDDGDIWLNEGNYIFEGCDGILTFSGIYTDEGSVPGGRVDQYEAEFAVTGGTGVYVGATGSVKTEYDAVTGVSERIITIH